MTRTGFMNYILLNMICWCCRLDPFFARKTCNTCLHYYLCECVCVCARPFVWSRAAIFRCFAVDMLGPTETVDHWAWAALSLSWLHIVLLNPLVDYERPQMTGLPNECQFHRVSCGIMRGPIASTQPDDVERRRNVFFDYATMQNSMKLTANYIVFSTVCRYVAGCCFLRRLPHSC